MTCALTRRQRQVLVLAANGRTNDQIGHALGISRHTADRHLAEVYKTLGARDRAHAVAIASLITGDLTANDLRTNQRTP